MNEQVPCAGRGCSHKDHCALYEPKLREAGKDGPTHGWLDSDFGWSCEEWKPLPKSEPEDDDGLGLF